MQHTFYVEWAKKYGMNVAVIATNIYYWMIKDKANESHYHDGHYWVYNSVKAWQELFPYMTKDQIRRALEKGVKDGLFLTGEFNEKAFDRTKWYTITPSGLGEIANYDLACTPNGVGSEAKPIPIINTIINTNINNSDLAESFDKFWKAYPKKKDKQEAVKAFKKIKPDEKLLNHILYAIGEEKKTDQWSKDDGKYIPMASTWLNKKRYLDYEPKRKVRYEQIYTGPEDLDDLLERAKYMQVVEVFDD